jgi:hypothetical protein
MKNTALIVLAVSLPLGADELQLKDGRKVEFKTLTDEGATYEITTSKGTKVSVKKEEVDRLIVGTPAEALTGAAFLFDKKTKLQTIDLLALCNPSAPGVVGTWKKAAGVLQGDGLQLKERDSVLPVKYTPPADEYDVSLVVERKAGLQNLSLGLIGGGHQFVFSFDSFSSTSSGVNCVDGKSHPENGVGVKGPAFITGVPRTVLLMIRKEALIVQVDGKDFFTWKADWNKVSVPPSLAVAEKNILFLGCYDASWLIRKMTLSAPKQ